MVATYDQIIVLCFAFLFLWLNTTYHSQYLRSESDSQCNYDEGKEKEFENRHRDFLHLKCVCDALRFKLKRCRFSRKLLDEAIVLRKCCHQLLLLHRLIVLLHGHIHRIGHID